MKNLVEKLNSLETYELHEDYDCGYQGCIASLQANELGEWVKLEDVARLFGLSLENGYYGRVQNCEETEQ